jgi:lipocalin
MLTSCRTIPVNAVAVNDFQKMKYLGKWYEIARLDFKYERNLIYTSAEYSLNADGSIKVYNKGYDTLKGEWTDATGKAKFVGENNIGMLKVSFFGPFYSGYNILALDMNGRQVDNNIAVIRDTTKRKGSNFLSNADSPTGARPDTTGYGAPLNSEINAEIIAEKNSETYHYVLVCGKNLKYLWILSRYKKIPSDIKKKYLLIARKAGFNTDALIWVRQDTSKNTNQTYF